MLLPSRPYTTFQYFSFAIESPSSPSNPGVPNFKVLVSGLTPGGNVDVFVGVGPTFVQPNNCPTATAGGSNYSSTNAPPLVQSLTIPNAAGGIWLIGVTGFTSGFNDFSISVVDPSKPTPLSPSIPIDGAVFPAPGNGVDYYSTNWNVTVRIRLWAGRKSTPLTKLPPPPPPPPPPHPHPPHTPPTPHPPPHPHAPAQSSSSTLTLDLYSWTGAADLAVDVNPGAGKKPDATSPFQLLASPGSNQMLFSALDPRLATAGCIVGGPTCTLSIGVLWAAAGAGGGASPTYYKLAATPSTATYNLTDAVPLTRILAPGASAYFAFTPTAPSNVSFALTLFSGSAALYAVSSSALPGQPVGPPAGPSSSTWSLGATQEGGVLTILASDKNYAPPATPPLPIFYLTVANVGVGNASYSPSLAVFSIAALTAPGGYFMTPIADGTPAVGTAAPHAMAYYYLNFTAAVAAGASTLDVFASADSGSAVEVFINPLPFSTLPPVYPQPSCATTDAATGLCSQWQGANYAYTSFGGARRGAFSMVLPSGTQKPSGYIIGVMAMDPDRVGGSGLHPAPPAQFTLTASSGTTVLTLLQTGAPLPGTVRRYLGPSSPGGVKFYGYLIPSPSADIVVNLDVSGGSLEAYALEYNTLVAPAPSAATPASLPGPSPAPSTWSTIAQGGTPQRSRYLRIPYASLSPGCRNSITYGLGTCGIAIGVYGAAGLLGAAGYTVSAAQSGSPGSPLLLPQGSTQFVTIPANGCAFVSGIPSGDGQGAAQYDYLYGQNQLGTATMYVNYNTQAFYVQGQGLLPDSVNTDQGGYEEFRNGRGGSSQNLYITLCAGSASDAQILLSYRNAFGVTPLDAGERTLGEVSCGTVSVCCAVCVRARACVCLPSVE